MGSLKYHYLVPSKKRITFGVNLKGTNTVIFKT